MLVETITLSSLINENVDFLKLDIEGLENKAIREVESKLHKVAQICIEFHGLNTWKENSLDEIVEILERNNFDVEVKHKIAKDIFPPNLFSWIESAGLSLATVHAKNRQQTDD